jgi:PEGA domain
MRALATNEAKSPSAGFSDGFGLRQRLADPATPEPLELLRLTSTLVAAPSFEFMLRERVSRLANFRHAYYSRVRRVDRLDGGTALGLISETPAGPRLSRILEVAEACGLELDVNAALCLVRQLVPAVALLHQNARDVSHGALAPERIVITGNARVVIGEYVLGAAIEQLGWNRERLWKELRVAVPSTAGLVRLSHRSDVMQLGMVALALVLGHPLHDDDLTSLRALVDAATETNGFGGRKPLSDSLRRWLSRALQLDARSSFESALEGQLALDDVLSGESGYIAAPIALETFLARYEEREASLLASPADAGAPEPPVREKAPVIVPVPAAAPEPVRVTPVAAEPIHAAPAPVVAPPPLSAPVARLDPAPVPPRVSEQDAVPPERDIEVAPLAAATGPSPVPARPRRVPAVVVEEPPPSGVARADEGRHHEQDRDDDESLRRLFASAAPVTRAGVAPVWRSIALALAVAVVGEGAFIGWKFEQSLSLLPVSAGTLKVESKPTGAQVKIDGKARGATPLTLSVATGPHVMELAAGGEPRVIPITVEAGATLGQYVELLVSSSSGTLSVSSTPQGATVLLDGQPRGITPADLPDVAAGDHELALELNGARVRQPVTVTAGNTTTVAVPLTPGGPPAAAPTTGTLVVKVPFEMQVFEGDTLLGLTTSRLSLSPGPHDVRIASDTLAFQTTAHVEIEAGKSSRVPVALPQGEISLNATPWAEVWIDGVKVGETPIGNLPIAIGPHEIVFKNPDLGEQHHATTVTAAEPARLSVDLTKPQ